MRDAVDDVRGSAVDTDSTFSDTCCDDYLENNDVNSVDDGRDDHVLDDNDDPIEKNEANRDFQRKIDQCFQTKRIYLNKKKKKKKLGYFKVSFFTRRIYKMIYTYSLSNIFNKL